MKMIQDIIIKPIISEASMDMMEQVGFGYDKMEELEIISPVLSVNCEYKSMVRFGDTVVIHAKVVRYNGVKLKMVYEMTDKKTGELRAVAESSHCFLTMAGKPLTLKRSYPELDTKFFTLVEDE